MASYQGEPSDAKALASAEPNWPNPGLLTFRKLAINKGQITRAEEKRMESTIQTQDNILHSKIYSEQLCNAGRNVKDVMLYHSNKKSEAIKIWEEILASDKTNLNALQDITLAYQKLRYNLKAQDYEALLRNTIRDASPNKKRMIFARCQAEQGYALSQDLHTQSWKGIDLLQEQVNCYEDALKMAEGLILGNREKRDWLLYTGKAYERLCHVSYRASKYDLYKDSIEKAIEKLHEALQMPDENALYQAEIWLTIGNTFARFTRHEAFVPPRIERCYEEGWKDPMICYKKALEFDPDNLWLLGRIGICLFKQYKYDCALKYLNQCIHDTDKLPPEDPQRNSSWNALYHRAKIYIKQAKGFGTLSEHHLLLKEAQLDVNRALEVSQSPMTLALAGEVNHMLTKNPHTQPKEVDHLRNVALDRFYEASVSQDGSTFSDVYLKWAECLQDGKDRPSAIELFKIAFDIEGTGVDFHASLASKLLNAMLGYYKDRPQQLIGEVAFWFMYTHKSSQAQPEYIKKLYVEYAPEILEILEYSSQHVSDKSTTAQEMIKPFKEVMNTQHIEDEAFKMRLSKLGEKRNPSLSQKQDPETSAIQEDDVPNDRPLTLGVDFDFYILHDGNNPEIRGWIRYSLLKGLECKFFALKGYYHQRDSRLGVYPYESEAEAMEKSAKILIVLSHGFDGSKNLTTEIAQGLHAKNKENVILLQREQVEVPTKLKVYKKFDFNVQVDLPQLARYLLPVPSLWDI